MATASELDDARLDALAQQLAEAHRQPARTVPAAAFAGLRVEDSMAIQARTLKLLGERALVTKVGIDAAGRGIAAPIYASLAGPDGTSIALPARGLLGIEVEIAIRLAAAITPEMAAAGEAAVLPAIANFHVGVEIVGSRFDDRAVAGANGQLADNLNTGGYVWSEVPWARGLDLKDVRIDVEVDGEAYWQGPGVNPFGSILTPVIAYARAPLDSFGALSAGMLVTTGSLCGLVAINRPCTIRAGLAGSAPVTLRLR
jgi:2-keto-4-pentenoate hydratase